MKESGAHAVKMEGGSEIKESIIKISKCWYSSYGSFRFNTSIYL